ncbi:MAG: hypothetical protein WBA68_09850 [Alteraurantiacibacter sp.]
MPAILLRSQPSQHVQRLQRVPDIIRHSTNGKQYRARISRELPVRHPASVFPEHFPPRTVMSAKGLLAVDPSL